MNSQWIIFAKKTFALERKYVPFIKKVIIKFRASFISDLKIHGKDYATQRLQLNHLNSPIALILQSIYKDAGLLGARMTHDEVKALAKQKAASFGRNANWISEVINFLKLHLLKFVSKITDTMREDILNIMQKAVDNGWSIDTTVRELKRTDLIEARARTIARTEIIRAANVGHSVGAKSLPYELNKKWIAAKDHRTRRSHIAINQHTTEEDGTFKVPIYEGKKLIGYDLMKYPGDATAHPSNTINCRCRVIYEPKRDAEGRLIPKRTDTATVIPISSNISQIPSQQIAAALKAHIFVGVEEK